MIVVQTPLRVSLLGGGTDFEDFYVNHGGAVLSSAIDKYVYVIVKERFDELICVNYSKREVVKVVDGLKHDLVREAMRLTGVEKGVEITTLADIPSEGTGLGSSSSITVGLLNALYAYQGEFKTAEALAQEACRIEVELLRKPIGRQDQYIAAYGNMRLFKFHNDGIEIQNVELEPKKKRLLGESLLLFYTGVTRSADSILFEQRANIGSNIEALKEMARLAYEGKRALAEGAVEELGYLLHRNWELKKELASGISNPAIEEMYQQARKAGALGGKVTGAGGGGFFLVCCLLERKEDVRRALKGLRELPFGFEGDGSKVIFNYRRYS
ncbi:MAG: GHMP kinase [Chloroflexi bacterium]|nr:GHMP kinase [Chloroflexota bacterium]